MESNVVGKHTRSGLSGVLGSKEGRDPQDLLRELENKTTEINKPNVEESQKARNELSDFSNKQLSNPEDNINRIRQQYQPTQADQQRIFNSILGEKYITSQQGRSNNLSGMSDVAMAGQLAWNEGLNNYVNQALTSQGMQNTAYLGGQNARLQANASQQTYNQGMLGIQSGNLKSYTEAYYNQQSRPTAEGSIFKSVLSSIGAFATHATSGIGGKIADYILK